MKTCRLRLILLLFILVLFVVACAPPPRQRVLWPLPPDEPRVEWLGTYASQDDFPKTGFQLFMEGITGKPALQTFESPFGVASEGDGIVYIADSLSRNLRVFDVNAKTTELYAKEGVFNRPNGLDLDEDGNLYVVDAGNRQVSVFDRNRRLLRIIGSPADLESPAYVAVDKARDRVYVSDPRAGKIVVFTLAGEKVREIGPKLAEDTYFVNPQGMDIDKEGNLFVAELLGARIAVLSVDGKFLRFFGERGDSFYQFEAPKDLAFDSDGNLWVVDNRRSQIYTYSPQGEILLASGSGVRGVDPLDFVSPTAIHIAPDDTIYVTDRMNRRFSVWGYLSGSYLTKRPLTDKDRQELREAKERAEAR